MELSHGQLKHVLNRYPRFDLCYETVSQNTELRDYDIAIAVPLGKKCMLWNTFYQNKDVLYLFELNKKLFTIVLFFTQLSYLQTLNF